jgi:hypothetical protein
MTDSGNEFDAVEPNEPMDNVRYSEGRLEM